MYHIWLFSMKKKRFIYFNQHFETLIKQHWRSKVIFLLKEIDRSRNCTKNRILHHSLIHIGSQFQSSIKKSWLNRLLHSITKYKIKNIIFKIKGLNLSAVDPSKVCVKKRVHMSNRIYKSYKKSGLTHFSEAIGCCGH